MVAGPTWYNLSAIRELLLAAFVPEDLRRLCQDQPLLRPVLDRFSPKHGLGDMVADLVDYCHDRRLWTDLLAAVRQARPEQYARFEPRLRQPDPDAGVVSRPLLDACQAQVAGVLAGLTHKYDPTLYVNRAIERDIETFFDAPFAGPAPNCFLIVAPAGSGKTNLLCDLARRRVARQPVVLLLGGSLYLSGDTGLLGAIQAEIEAAGPQVQFRSAADCLHSLGRLAEELDRDALLAIDAINEHDSPDDMKKALGNLLRATRGKRVKLLVTCRDYYWGLFQADFWQAALANRPPADPGAEEAESPAGEGFSRFAAAEHERALALYLDHYQIAGRPVGVAAEQCRQPLLLRFFCEAYRGQEVGELEDIRLKELFDRYWDRKLASVADLMAKQRRQADPWLGGAELAAAVGDYLLNVAAYMLRHNVRTVPLVDIGQAGGRQELPGDRLSYYGRIRDEFIIWEEVERGQGRRRAGQVAFVYEEFMEYAMARSLIRDWDRANLDESAILAEIEALTGKYRPSFAQILGVMIYLGLMLKEQRGLALWPLLLNKGEQWRSVVFETFRKLPTDQLDAGVFDALSEMLKGDQDDIRLQVLDTLKAKRVGQAAPAAVFALVAGLAEGEDRPIARRAALVLGYAPPDLAVPVLCRLVQDAAKRSVRENAVTSLGRLGDARAVEPLIAALNDMNWEVRRNAAAALGKLGDAAVMPLIAVLARGNREARRAAQAPDRLGDGQAIEPLIAALKDGDGEAQRRAAQALGELGDSRAAMSLIDALEDGDEGVRQCAAEALEKLGGGRAAQQLIAALKDGDEGVRRLVALQLSDIWSRLDLDLPGNMERLAWQGAAEALATLEDARAVEPFIVALADGDKEVRWIAAEALGRLGDARAVEPLIAALQDGDKEVRVAAAEALGRLGDARAVEPLIAALSDGYWTVQRAAAEALGRLGDSRAVEPLVAALRSRDKEVRQAAAAALSQLGDARAVELLMPVLGDGDWLVRGSATEALGMLGDLAVGPLIAALGDGDKAVRKRAAKALRHIGTPEALAAVQECEE